MTWVDWLFFEVPRLAGDSLGWWAEAFVFLALALVVAEGLVLVPLGLVALLLGAG